KIAESGTIQAVVSLGPERFTVPDLANETVAQAEERLKESNLTVADQPKEKYSETIEAGKVISTDPPAGAALKREALVTLIVSKGAKPSPIPDVVGKSVQEATDLLQGVGFKVSVTEQDNDQVANGTVLGQSPPGGGTRKAPKGTTIELVVAKSALVEVPRVIGMDIDEARNLLEGLGFNVDRAGFPFGSRVVSQNPDPGTRVPRGSTVTLRTF
ncbi:MAG TPA: PASTA domain-containing protein, partial [Sporichthya sp.]|nr:PASTA domain-containing protein [Sporichthya sp.]